MHKKLVYIILTTIVTITWIWAAIEPVYYDDWLLENVLVGIFALLIFGTGWKFEFSQLSYLLMSIFIILHIIGSHYTYSEVPWGVQLGQWLGSERNMYDRLVHLLFGVLFVYPLREISVRIANAKGFWGYFVPFMIISAFAGFYEILEWGAAISVDPEAGAAFLGSQGDIWDAQKDMVLAVIGAIGTLTIVMGIHIILDKAFYQEFKESFRLPKDDKPMGEVVLKELMEER